MKKEKGIFLGCFSAFLTAAALWLVALSPALIMVACEAYFPLEVIPPDPEQPREINTRTLTSASAVPGIGGDYTLTLNFGAGAVEGLDKTDISLTTDDPLCLLSKQGGLVAAEQAGTYTLKIGAVVKGARRTGEVTVSAGGKKPNGTWLTGSARVMVEFTPVSESHYKVFSLAQAKTDGKIGTADTKLELTLVADKAEYLPTLQSAGDILISTVTDGLTMNKGLITSALVNPGPPASQNWELALSQVSKNGEALVEVSVDGYVQENKFGKVDFHAFGIVFESAEEDWQANTGTSTDLFLSFSKNIPGGGLKQEHITIQPLTPGGNLSIGNITPGALNGQYKVGISWGTVPTNWKHEAEVTVTVPDTVITPSTQKVFLSMKRVDTPLAGALSPAQGTLPDLALRRVPGGKFKRDGESGSISQLSAYWMGETEVTQELWQAVMGYNPTIPAEFRGTNKPVNNITWVEAIVFCNKLSLMEGRVPVYSVNKSYTSKKGISGPFQNSTQWAAFKTGSGLADTSSDWPTTLDDWKNIHVDAGGDFKGLDAFTIGYWPGTPPAPPFAFYEAQMVSKSPMNTPNGGYRLPTHHQWMWAAMGADMSPAKLVNGVNVWDKNKIFAGFNGNNNVEDYAWVASNDNGGIQPVGTTNLSPRKPNELGIYDLSGNVLEWCYDQWRPTLTHFPAPPDDPRVQNPMGDDEHYFAGEAYKVIKGGSWASEAPELLFGFYNRHIRKLNGDVERDPASAGAENGLRVMRRVEQLE